MTTSPAVPDWFENDDLFRTQLVKGHQWAEYVAACLTRTGLDVDVTPMAWRNNIEDRRNFADEHDLTVSGHTRDVRLDVKSRALLFTSTATYPYETAFVDTVRGWRAKIHKPSAIVLVSQLTGSMLVIPRSTESEWVEEQKHDNTRGIDESFYVVDRSALTSFDLLVDWLHQQ